MAPEKRLPPFDLRLAMDTLAAKDPQLAPLIKEAQEFRVETDGTESPYEVLLESIAYQSISGKAAATIFARVRALRRKNRCDEGFGAQDAVRRGSFPRPGRAALRRRARRAAHFRPRHRRLDRRDVPDLPPRPPGRPSHPRPGREKRLVHHLRQEAHAQTQGASRLWRALAPLPHRRQLVHVACVPARRQRRHAQNPPGPHAPEAQTRLRKAQARTPRTQIRVAQAFGPELFHAFLA